MARQPADRAATVVGPDDKGAFRVLLVEDHAVFREALSLILEREPDIAAVRQAGTVAEALPLLGDIDVAIIDLKLPDGSGCDVLRQIHADGVDASTVVLTASSDELELAEAVEAGADAVIQKSGTMREIIEAVRKLSRGEPVMRPKDVVRRLGVLARARSQDADVAAALAQLTRREREVLRALADGLSDKQIADRLSVSPDTARNHVANILGKLRVESRLQAALLAVRHGDAASR